jgi:hypothetical protein
MMSQLATKILDRYGNKRFLVIAFAEAATALGVVVSKHLDAFLLCTTREKLPECCYFQFDEEHSHAPSHYLRSDLWDVWMQNADRILLIDDEFSTGKTILNLVRCLRQRPSIRNKKFSACSLVSFMSSENKSLFAENDIDLLSLAHVQKRMDYVGSILPSQRIPEISVPRTNPCWLPGMKSLSQGVYGRYYEEIVRQLSQRVIARMPGIRPDERVLFLGTEECMFPAIRVASDVMYRTDSDNVWVQSLTRSPLAVFDDPDYPIYSALQMVSPYDETHNDFVYNIEQYDRVCVITDSQNPNCNLQNLQIAFQPRNQFLSVQWSA